jgi:hypothetical protein
MKMKMSRYIPSDYADFIILSQLYPKLIEDEDIVISKDAVWARKKYRDFKKINELVKKSVRRYLSADSNKINIKSHLL